MNVRRLLLFGSDKFDSIGDSFHRTLAPHYDVRLLNPDEIVPSRFTIGGRAHPTRVTAAIDLLSRALLDDPLALAFSRMRQAVAEFKPQLIVTTAPERIPPALIDDFRRLSPGVHIVGLFGDAIVNFGRGYFFVAEYDALFFKDHFIVDKLRAKLSWQHVFYLPQACDPALHHSVPLSARDLDTFGSDLTIAGNVHTFRAREFEPLMKRYRLRIWGGAVPRWLDHPIRQCCESRYVAGEDKCKAMLAAKIVLNANHYGEIDGTNKRTFEIAAIGAFQLADTPALKDVFEPDVEVATFTSQSDMLEKIDYYLARQDLREEMATRAQLRAHREHTYAHRWAAMMAVMGFAVPSSFPVSPKDLRVTAR